jgi:DNA-binding CsgD family transcriptional regulator
MPDRQRTSAFIKGTGITNQLSGKGLRPRSEYLNRGLGAVMHMRVGGTTRRLSGGCSTSPDHVNTISESSPQVIRECMCSPLDASLAAAMADALDNLSASVFLVDAEGRIVHANAAAQLVLAARDVLCSAAGRLTACDAAANRILQDALSGGGNRNVPIDNKGMALPLMARDGTRYVASVLPLTAGVRRRSGMAYAATAAVFVNEAVLDARSLPEIIVKAYKLTPTELRILLAVIEGGGIREVAEALGVAESTVKTHLGRVFEKTGTSRQADLVRLIAGFSSSLVR